MRQKLTASNVKRLTPQTKPYEVRDTEIRGFLLRIQPSGSMTYYYDYRNRDGKRCRYRIGNVSAEAARDTAKQKAAEVALGQDPHQEKKASRKRADQAKASTLKGFLEHKYGPWVTAERKTGDETLKRIRTNFADLLSRPLGEVNTWVVEKWRAEQRKAGKEVSTINRDVVALKAALSKAVEWGLIDAHPLTKLKPVKTDKKGKVRYLTGEEEKRLRGALDAREARIRAGRESANEWRRVRGYDQLPDLQGWTYVDHLKPLVLLSINTGLRRGEAFSLTWENISLHTRTLTVEGHTAKSGSTRHIPLNDEALAVLKAWMTQTAGEGLVFPGKDGNRLDNVRKAWVGVLVAAKVNNFRWHDQRHHFASKLVMAGVDLNTVRELLGHTSLEVTLRYAHLAPEHKAEAVGRLVSS